MFRSLSKLIQHCGRKVRGRRIPQLEFLKPRLDWGVLHHTSDRLVGYTARLIIWDESISGQHWFEENPGDVVWMTETKCPFNEPFGAYPIHDLGVSHPKSHPEALADDEVIRRACTEFKNRTPFDTIKSEWHYWEEDPGDIGIIYEGLIVSRVAESYKIGIASLVRCYEEEPFDSLDRITMNDVRQNGIDGCCEITVPAEAFEREYFNRMTP